MAKVDDTALHNFSTGETVTESTLDQNFKVLQAALNDNDQVLEDLGIGSFSPVTFNTLLKTSTTFNQLKFGYVKNITDPMQATISSHESRIAALESLINSSSGSGTLDGGTF
jgi:hypothetical protein